jgi:four helix bundle protein
MGVRRLSDLVVYQLAVEFKLGVYRIVESHPRAEEDRRYRSQLFDAASSVEANIAEGWRRYRPREMAQYFRVGLGSLEEAKTRLTDGAHRRYFKMSDIADTLTTGNRCGAALMSLIRAVSKFRTDSDR